MLEIIKNDEECRKLIATKNDNFAKTKSMILKIIYNCAVQVQFCRRKEL